MRDRATSPTGILFLTVLLAAAQPSSADNSKIGPSFLDRTYLMGPWGVSEGDGNLILEAQVRPTLTLFNNFEERLRSLKPGLITGPDDLNATTKASVLAIAIVPELHLRIYKDISSPVRTPSHLPHVKVRWGFTRIASAEDCLSSSRAVPGAEEAKYRDCIWTKPRDLGVLILDAGHYSNGQEGCIFAAQSRSGEDCVPTTDRLVPLDRYPTNHVNGSFSIALFVRAGVGVKRLWTARASPQCCGLGYPVARSLSLEATWEFQPNSGGLGGVMPADIRRIYGDKRARVTSRFDLEAPRGRLPGTWSFTASVERNSSKSDGVPKVSVLAEVARSFVRFKDAGLFLRFYQGQDYYNVHFLEKTRRLQFGLVFEQVTRGGLYTQ